MYSRPKAISKVRTRMFTFETLRFNFSQLENQKGFVLKVSVNTVRLTAVENDAYFNIPIAQKVRSESILTVVLTFTAGSTPIEID